MPDRSYYPSDPEMSDSIFIETTSDPGQFMKDSLLVASYRDAARNANIPVNHTFGAEGQTLQFQTAADKLQVEEIVRESENSLVHTETITKDHQHPYYVQAWGKVVDNAMAGREHPVDVNVCEDLAPDPQVFVMFPDQETKQLFDNLNRDGFFTEFAVLECRTMMQKDGIDAKGPASVIDQQVVGA